MGKKQGGKITVRFNQDIIERINQSGQSNSEFIRSCIEEFFKNQENTVRQNVGQSVGHVGHVGQSVGQDVGHVGQSVGHVGQSVGQQPPHNPQNLRENTVRQNVGQSVGQDVGHVGQSVGHVGQSVGQQPPHNPQNLRENTVRQNVGQSVGQDVGHVGQSVGQDETVTDDVYNEIFNQIYNLEIQPLQKELKNKDEIITLLKETIEQTKADKQFFKRQLQIFTEYVFENDD